MRLAAYVFKNLSTVFGVVLVWRGVWYLLDEMDKLLFGGSHIWTAVSGVLLGVALLYWPDKNLAELKKLKD